MVISMTAFARVQAEHANHSLVWEIRSVNHRFLEASLRLPEAMRGLEHGLKERLRKRLSRGKVDATLRIDTQQTQQSQLNIDPAALTRVLQAIAQITEQAEIVAPPTSLEVLKFPGVMGSPSKDPAAVANLHKAIDQLFDQALDELIAHREREGAQLQQALTQRLDEIATITEQVSVQAASLNQDIKAKLHTRLTDLLSKGLADAANGLDDNRLEQEVALLAQKADIAEELDRLKIHIAEARNNLAAAGPHGRRLDFLTQELNREANTIASKSTQAQTSTHAVDLKVLIEQIREQVQNIE